MVIIIFVIFLLMAGGGTAAWYFLYYKPRQGPAPAPVYVSAPVTYTIAPSIPSPSIPSPTTDEEEDGEDDYDPIELGDVLSPAGSPSAAFSIALWRAKMKKKFGKNRTVLEKRLKVLEDARDADNEQSGTVPSEHFEDAIAYLKTLIKTLPKASAPRGPFVYSKWKTSVVEFFEKKTIDDVRKAIDELKAAKKAGLGVKNNIPKARYDDAITWIETILKKKEKKLEETFDLDKWKVSTKNELKGKRPAVITARIDRLKDAQTKKLSIKDGVPRSKYNEAIAWLRVLETEAKKSGKKFDFATWKTDTKEEIGDKKREEIQKKYIDNYDAKYKNIVPASKKAEAIAFLKSLKTKAKAK